MFETTLLICSKPAEVARRCQQEEQLLLLVKTSLLLMLLCSAVFGLVLGSSRDSAQAMATALKLPMVWILTLAICTPAFYALAAVLGHGVRVRALLALVLAAAARASLVLFALLPCLWLLIESLGDSGLNYHRVTMGAALIYAFAGLAALGVLLRAFGPPKTALPVLAAFLCSFFLVAGQTAWSLRPFVGRPSQESVPFFRQPEGTFLAALMLGSESARGHYRDAPAPASAPDVAFEPEE
jgi:hypothetical protein